MCLRAKPFCEGTSASIRFFEQTHRRESKKMETLALAHLTLVYEDPNPPQLRSVDLKIPSSAWIGVVGIVLSLLVFSTPPEPAQAYDCGLGDSHAVKVSTNGSPLRIRSGPSTAYGVIGSLSNGSHVATTGQVSNGWIELSNGGWIASNWVAGVSSDSGGGTGGVPTVKVSTNGSGLRIRSGPGTGYAVIGGLSNGTTVRTTGQVSNGWIELSSGGWIAGNWVAGVSSDSGGGAGGGGNRVATNGSPLLMRNGPGGAVIGSLANGSRISLTGRYSGSWAELTNGAWVSSRWIR